MRPILPKLLSAAAFALAVNPADPLDVLFVDNETPDPSSQALIESGGHPSQRPATGKNGESARNFDFLSIGNMLHPSGPPRPL